MSEIADEPSIRLPLRAVIDSCVIPNTNAWLRDIEINARDGLVLPIWSPLIIAESNRISTWLWLRRESKRTGSELRGATCAESTSLFTEETERRLSLAAKKQFQYLTRCFRVVDDHPPMEKSWTENPRDEWDIPIWTAAKRANAQFVVTVNLSDAPPKDSDGIQEHEGIYYLHPSAFLALLNRVADEDLDDAPIQFLEEGDPWAPAMEPSATLRDLILQAIRNTRSGLGSTVR
jgi:hypothetical protein